MKDAQDAAQDAPTELTAQLLAFSRGRPASIQRLLMSGQLVSNFADLLRRTLGKWIEFRTIVERIGGIRP